MPTEAPANPSETAVRPGSFADLLDGINTGDDATPTPEPAAEPSEPAKDTPPAKPAPEPKAPKDEPKPSKEPAKPDPNANPHLDEEPAPKAEKKAAPADDEIPAEYTKGMTEKAAAKARETWKTNKADRAEALAGLAQAQAELAAAKKQIEEVSKGGEELARLRQEREALQKQIEEMQSEISVSRIEATPEFKAKVSGPIKASEDVAKAIAGRYEGTDLGALLNALREPDAAKRADMLSDLASDFKTYDQNALFRAADQYAEAQHVAEELRSNASTKLKAMTEQEQQASERAATENIQSYRKAAGSAWSDLQERLPILRPVEGKPEWNARLDGIRQQIEGLPINELPVADVAKMAAAQFALDDVTKAMDHFRKISRERGEEIGKLKEQLADFLGTEPGAGGGTRDEDGPTTAPKRFADIDIPGLPSE